MAITPEDVEALWERLDREEQEWKLANHALIELERVYAALGENDRRVVDGVLAGWLESDNGRKQFDAAGLARRFTIRSVLPAVQSELAKIDPAALGPAGGRREMLEELAARLGDGRAQ